MKLLATASIALVVLLFSSSCASTESQTVPPPRAYFDIHADKWMSLHHFAYHATRALAERRPRGLVDLDPADLELLRGDSAAAFAPLAEAYAPYARQSILHSTETRSIAKALTRGREQIADENLQRALADFMPVYEKHFWPRHKKWSTRFSSSLTAQLERYGSQMVARLTSLVEQDWPADPIRVDIVPYANWAGAYTDNNPPHVTLGANDPEISEFAFEMVFHEASHTSPLGLAIDSAATAALREAGIESNRYWHYLLFYLSGRAATDVLNDPNYVPYAHATGRTASPDAAPYYAALALVWDREDNLADRATAAALEVAKSQSSSRQPAK